MKLEKIINIYKNIDSYFLWKNKQDRVRVVFCLLKIKQIRIELSTQQMQDPKKFNQVGQLLKLPIRIEATFRLY